MQTSRSVSITACVLAGFCGPAAAQLVFDFSTSLPDGGQIADANPAGWSDTRTLSGLPSGTILDLNVRLAVAAGFNGDLYAYLTHGSGFSVLLNRVGRTGSAPFGYGDAGLSVTFDDEAVGPADIHSYQSVSGSSVSGGAAWRPDARDVDPATVLETDARSAFLSSFVGVDPNGEWTLFVADLSGGEVSQVTSWGLVIAVPEPSHVLVLVAAAAYACGVRLRTASRRPRS
ncbi:hypothetical protein BAC2_03487 [uncultured bacterium]|nr:hypothetical protein BAC2_03487 [uncultured bacterium]